MHNKISVILILMAGASLVSMLATLRIDSIVHHDLYSYGLQFSTQWAIPYWTMAAIVFSMGWFTILTSIAFELHLVMHRLHMSSKHEAPITQQEPTQQEIPRIDAESSARPDEEQVMTTALALKKEEKDDMLVLLEEISVVTHAKVAPQKADDKQTNGN
jgi:hypothetical protein